MSRVKLPPAVPLLVLSGLYLIFLGCGGLLPGSLPLPAPPNGSAGAVSVSISPQTAALSAGNSLQFTATSYGPPPTDLEWLVNGVPEGNSASGTISRSGLYIAPQQVTSDAVNIVAVSSKTEPTKASSATVTVLSGPAPIGAVVVLSITPTSASVPTAGVQLFTASVTGTSNTAVTWGLSGAGCSGSSCGTLSTSSLSASAVYLAPSAAPTPASVNVIATSVVDPAKSESTNLTIVPSIVVGVTPANVSATAGVTQQFSASVTGTSKTAVAWTVSGTGCSGTACGTISSNGLYTAPTAVPSSATVTITATSVADPTKSASAAVTIVPPAGTTYYLAPAAAGGSDSNNGTSASTPWLTPNHAVNCGDVILAVPSTAYQQANFGWSSWGTVSCAAGNNVAWLKCATFDACIITIPSNQGAYAGGMEVTQSYWGIQGWEIDNQGALSSGACFQFQGTGSNLIHHVIFANDIANGCGEGGFQGSPDNPAGYDYWAVVGSIAYNTIAGNSGCFSGFDAYGPMAYDTKPGTHIYWGGNFSWGNMGPNPCGGGTPTDGQGFMFDTANDNSYNQQMVMENNIAVFNGGPGFKVYNSTSGANVYITNNTSFSNELGDLEAASCAEIAVEDTGNAQVSMNLAQTAAATTCYGPTNISVLSVTQTFTGSVVYGNYGYSARSYNTNAYGTGFTFGPNNTFANPLFANAPSSSPAAPSCGSYASVPACMASLIAGLTPTNAAAVGYGYQIPSSTNVYDPLFPQWLCNVNLPTGLISMGCKAGP